MTVWATGGNAHHATISLKATPSGDGEPSFSFGCGAGDGTSSCDLGTVDARSTPRQLQARLTVPVTATKVTSVSLIATGNAAGLPKASTAAATVAITAPPKPTTSPTPRTSPTSKTSTVSRTAIFPPVASTLLPPTPGTIISQLPVGTLPAVGSLPGIPTANPSQSPPAVSAASLFPTLAPKPTPSLAEKARTRPLANTSALPEGAPIAGAQIAGLAALALAFVLAVTRLSIRRRPAGKPAPETAAGPVPETADKPDAATADKPADQQGSKGSKDSAGDQGTEEALPEIPPTDGE